MTKKAIIYCRVSSKKQATEGHGLQSQEVRCREFASARNYTVMAVFMDDITGAASERPAMTAMLKMLKSHRGKDPHFVIVDDISRLARDLPLFRELKHAISAAGGTLMSPNQIFAEDGDPDMEFFESMSALGAERGGLIYPNSRSRFISVLPAACRRNAVVALARREGVA